MDSFDFRPEADSQAGDGQLYNSEQVAPDEFYNCTWEALRQTARVFGFTGFDDEELRRVANALYARGAYAKGERWETNIGVAQRTWPALAACMWAEYPSDIVAAIHSYGEQGFRVHCGFWCDSAANVPAIGAVSYSHALLSLWGDNGGIGWVNPEPHPDTYLSDDQVRALYDGGGILVFKRSLLATTQEVDDMPAQSWVLPPRYFQPGDKAIYLPDVNCDVDDLFVAAAGCDEGDGSVAVVFTDGTNPAGPALNSSTLTFTHSNDAVARQANGVARVVIEPPTAACWISAKVQKKVA